MSLAEFGTILSLLLGVISLLGLAYAVAVRLARLELKVETIWEFLMRRALAEAIEKEVGKMNSPLTLNHDARGWVEPLAAELQAFYKSLNQRLPASQLALLIERRFGERIVKEICIPHGISQGACLLIASQVAAQEDLLLSSDSTIILKHTE